MMQPTNHRKPMMAMLIATFALISTAAFQNCAAQKSSFDNAASTSATGTSTLSSVATSSTAQNITTVYSTTRDGIAQTSFSVNQVMHGKVTGLGAQNIASCTEILGSNSCSMNDKFTDMPANGWTFDGTAWRVAITITSDYVGKSFRSFWLDKATGHKSAGLEFKVLAANSPAAVACSWTGGGSVIGPCSAHTKTCSASTINTQDSVQCGNGPITQFCACN